MRAAAVAVILVATGSARADRGTVLSIGGIMDMRFPGHTWDAANKVDTPTVFGGGRLTLTFEDPPLPRTAKGKATAEGRLVPELLVGTALGSQLGEGYAGAGLRGELHMATWKMRLGMYVAARAIAIGGRQNGEGEFAFGEYIQVTDTFRFGWEGAAVVRSQDHDGDRELGCVVQMYVGRTL